MASPEESEPTTTAAPVLVIGAGPAGLAASVSLRAEGVAHRLVDRLGATGGAYPRVHPEIVLASPRRHTSLPGLPIEGDAEYVTTGEYARYLERYAAHFDITAEKAEVAAIERGEDGRFIVDLDSGTGTGTGTETSQRYEAVIAATGMYDFPVRPAIEGLPGDGDGSESRPRVLHARAWRGAADLDPNEPVLVIGGATSGVEIAEACARAGIPTVVSTRDGKAKLAPQRFLGRDLHDYAVWIEMLPRWTLGSYCSRRPTLPATDLGFSRFVDEGKITVRGPVARLEGREAVFEDGAREPVGTVILATGYGFLMPFLPDEVARSPDGSFPLAKGGESRSWPGLFFVGIWCARGSDSEYLRGMAKDAPAIAREIGRRLARAPA